MVSLRKCASITLSLLCLVQLAAQVATTQFGSYVTVNTPARSFTHGVGDPLPSIGRRYQAFKNSQDQPQARSNGGYPRVKPTIPFNHEERPRGSSLSASPWQHNRNNYMDVAIPILPASPYKVDSPDPESLWPEGLFLPPITPLRYGAFGRRSDADADPNDPYLLEGSEAVAAVARAKNHGPLYFHDIPHIQSLLENIQLRVQNRLEPHRLGSIRHTWPYYRP